MDYNKEFEKITKQMNELHFKKNANYGNSFSQLFDKLGPISGLVPLHNKLDRATNLIKGGKNDFESLEDTLIDLANYAIMLILELKKDTIEETKASITNYYTDTMPSVLASSCTKCIKKHIINGCDGCPNNVSITSYTPEVNYLNELNTTTKPKYYQMNLFEDYDEDGQSKVK